MGKRFTSLRVIGTIFKVLAWICLILGLLGSVAMLILGITLGNQGGILGVTMNGALAGMALFVAMLLLAVISFLSLYGIGEAIYLLLALEDNTRRSAYLLQQQFSSTLEGYPHSVPEQDVED